MPRLSVQNPSLRRHKASGQAVVTLGGRDFYLGPWKSAKAKAEYKRRIREWNAGGGIHHVNAHGLTLVELLAAFKRHAKGYYIGPDGKPNREYLNYVTLTKRLSDAYGRTLASEFGPLRLKAFRQSLIDAERTRLASSTLQVEILDGAAWQMLQRLTATGLIGFTEVRTRILQQGDAAKADGAGEQDMAA